MYETKNSIAFYFQKAKDLETDVEFSDLGIRDFYAKKVKEIYDIIYDRVMKTDISPFLKQEVEQWYGMNRDFIGFTPQKEINNELESMLQRFNFI